MVAKYVANKSRYKSLFECVGEHLCVLPLEFLSHDLPYHP